MANSFTTAPEPHRPTEAEAFQAERSPYWPAALALAMILSGDVAIVIAVLGALG
jgi:hypothetical protein